MKTKLMGVLLAFGIATALLFWSRREAPEAPAEKKVADRATTVSFRGETILGVLKVYESIAREPLSPSVVVIRQNRIVGDFDVSLENSERTLAQLDEVLKSNGIVVHRTTHTRVLVADVLRDTK